MTTGRTNLAASPGFEYDFFICHAAEDKPGFVSELAAELASRNCRVWFDDFVLTIGDSLRRAIDRGLEFLAIWGGRAEPRLLRKEMG